MKKRRLYPREYAAVFGAAGLVVAILFPLFARSRPSDSPYGRCPSNLKQISMALMQYCADYNGLLPSVRGGGTNFGWADSLRPYSKAKYVFQCPSNTGQGQDNPTKSSFTDYWFNTRLSGRALTGVVSPTPTFLLGDGNDGTDTTDARYSRSFFPSTWKTSTNSPIARHLGMGNYIFADGHFKAISLLQATNASRFHF